MARLEWDKPGDRRFQAGLDRGVLYYRDVVEPWNGLTGVDDATPGSSKAYYQDGVKYLDFIQLGEFEGTLKAFTYPDIFEEVQGVVQDPASGVYYHDQPPQKFALSYRTLLGDDAQGLSRGYVIHMLYNLHAVASSLSYTTIGASTDPTEFSWALSSTPIRLPGRRPTAHLSIRSADVDPARLAKLEELLYGSPSYDPMIPEPTDVIEIISDDDQRSVVIVDNGDGTWTADGSLHDVRVLSGGQFEVDDVDATFTDEDTYELPTG